MRRARLIVQCPSIDEVLSECLGWYGVLSEHDCHCKCNAPDRRITTDHAIIDFVCEMPERVGGHIVLTPSQEDGPKIFAYAIGEDPDKVE